MRSKIGSAVFGFFPPYTWTTFTCARGTRRAHVKVDVRTSSFTCARRAHVYLVDVRTCSEKQEALLLSVEVLQLQNISLENPIVWHYLRDSTFSRFDTIPECDRHTHRQTDIHTTTAYSALSIASRGKNRPYCTAHHYNYHCRQRATVDSKMYG